jgi:hypothetical protein
MDLLRAMHSPSASFWTSAPSTARVQSCFQPFVAAPRRVVVRAEAPAILWPRYDPGEGFGHAVKAQGVELIESVLHDSATQLAGEH